MRLTIAVILALLAPLAPGVASAATYQVGPSRTYTALGDLPALSPGDVVEVDGDFSYAPVVLDQAGTAAAPITYRGVRVNGRRPVIAGGSDSVAIYGNHTVFEGFEVTGGSERCILHRAHEVVIRDTVVHDCAQHGILGWDFDTGSLTLEYVEVYGCGGGQYDHQIYMATNMEDYPGAVFRMQHCYVHDANGGHNVKSRAERNEIYYNWIEGAGYHELELIGPDGSPDLFREDSDVACNVLRKTGSNADFYVVRIGGDGTGETNGRYRFFHNTIILSDDPGAAALWRLFDGVESVEMHNNAIARETSSGGIDLYRDAEVDWVDGERMVGQNNAIPAGSIDIPADWSNTIETNGPAIDMRTMKPLEGSALVDAAATAPAGPAGHELPNPLAACAYHPPLAQLEAVGSAAPRPLVGTPDIGAYELGDGPPVDPTTSSSSSSTSTSSSSTGTGAGGSGAGGRSAGGGDGSGGAQTSPGGAPRNPGCACASAPAGAPSPRALALAVLAAGIVLARRARPART